MDEVKTDNSEVIARLTRERDDVWQGATYACVPVSNELVMRCWPVEQRQEVAL